MEQILKRHETTTGTWDEEHLKALLHFPRFPMRLIQQEPWQEWIGRRGGLKAVYAYLQTYPLAPSHRRILDVVLSNPESVAGVYADRLNISRATYFYQLRELVPALVQALNHWDPDGASSIPEPTSPQHPNLPVPLTPLVGLESTLHTLLRLLRHDDLRLLTLLGPGGIGKTRLAIELVRRIGGEVAFVDLSALRDSTLVVGTIAEALGLADVRESALKSHLQAHAFFLVLDNFEQLLPARDVVTDLLAAAPHLRILITSRAALHIYGEHEFVVPALGLPGLDALEDPKDWQRSPAVALFVQRAQAVNPAFILTGENVEAVAELCRRMEGLPLAVELAAFQAKYFSPQAMLVRLSSAHCLSFLSQVPRRMPAHQQTMRAMLDWSYDLLSADLQTLFCRLAVFPGGCTIEAAEAICSNVDAQLGLTALADQSLLEQKAGPDGEPRFHMAGMLREYALERLDARGETEALQRLHALYFLQVAERANKTQPARGGNELRVGSLPALVSGLAWQTPSNAQANTFALMHSEYPNLCAALQWSIDRREGELGLRFVVALWDYWKSAGDLHEGRQMAQAVIDQTGGLKLPIRAHVLRLAGWLAHDLRDATTMQWAFQAGRELSESLGDRCETGLALHGLGELAQLRGQFAQARATLEETVQLFDELHNEKHLAWSHDLLGRIELARGELPAAQACFQHSLDIFSRLDSHSGFTTALVHLGQSLYYQGLVESAEPVLAQALSLSRAAGSVRSAASALALNLLAELAGLRSQTKLARELNYEALCLGKSGGYGWIIEQANFTIGLLALQAGDLETAAGALRESLALQQSFQEGWRTLALLEAGGELSIARGDDLGAARLFGAVQALRQSLGIVQLPVYGQFYQAGLAALQARLEPAALAEAWQAGRTLAMDRALAYGIRCLE